MENASGTIDIEQALKILIKSDRACHDLRASEGALAVEMFLSGEIEGDLGGEISNFFIDQITNESDTVSEGVLPNGYPVYVKNYEGIYYVCSVDYWDTGYFLSEECADKFIAMNW